jgi:hypothetical protein
MKSIWQYCSLSGEEERCGAEFFPTDQTNPAIFPLREPTWGWRIRMATPWLGYPTSASCSRAICASTDHSIL